ncbi:MAG: ATP-binding cassette domain-containing protein, partial [Oscillospiraceae bacterium]
MAYIALKDIVKRYQMGEVTITAVEDISFEIAQGEFCVIVGPSGAGKTTVLNILGGMDTADEGTITVDDQIVSGYTKKQLTSYRRYDIGFVFQFYNLVQNLTALENVELATQICKNPLPAKEVLEHVGLGERLNNFPAQLSGGEQQRVAIARA